jgi:WD40 repeat protein
MTSVEEAVTVHQCNWSVAQAKPCQSQTLGDTRGRAVAISPDEKRIAVGGEDGTVTIYDIFGKLLGKAWSVGAPIIALGWAEQRDWIAAGTSGGEILVLDVASQAGSVIARERLGDRPITVLAWSPKDLHVAFVCNGSSICLWQANADDAQHPFKPIIRFEGHLNAVTRLSWSPSGRHLASTAADATIRIWDLVPNTDASFALYADRPTELLTVNTSLDGKWLAAGGGDGTIRLWDAITGAPAPAAAPRSESEVEFLAWSRNGTLGAIYEDSHVGIVSADRQQPSVTLETVGEESRITWADQGSILAIPLRDSRIALVDVTDSARGQIVYLGTAGAKEAGWGVAVDPAGRTLFVGHANGELAAWDLATKSPAPPLQNTRADRVKNVAVGSLSVSPDGRWLAASGADRFVTVYDLARRINRLDLETEASETRTVAFSPAGQKLAALGVDHRVYVWNFDNGTATRILAVDAIPTRATIGDGSRSGERAGWLTWMSEDTIAIATASAAITAIRLDPARWRRRIDALAQKQLTP